jgi:CubicO group peptidase (beta-lactamase class C family)
MRLLALVSSLALLLVAPQQPTSSRVEQGLRGPVAIAGQPPVRHTLADRMAALGVPGVSIAVVEDGRVAWARGYGQTGGGGPVSPHTLFQAASLSKPVASMVALRLVELGRLSLDEDVNVKLRSWTVPASPASDGEAVTLRRLLSHTAGLTVSGFPGYAAHMPVPSLRQLLEGGAPSNTPAVRIDMKPGSAYRYSGGGYQVMQVLVEDVTGRAFAEVARELVLEPLGMTRSTFEQPLPAGRLGEAAAGHDDNGSVIPGLRHTYPEQTAAGLWTTPSDFAQVILEMQAPGRVLTRDTVEIMLTPVMNRYGLGFGVQATDEQPSFAHTGSNAGFRCIFRGYRDAARGAVVMTNGARGSQLASEVIRSIAAEYGWPDAAQREITVVDVPAATLQTYAGRYQIGADSIVVTMDGGALVVRTPGGLRGVLRPVGDASFVDEEGVLPDVTFTREGAGGMRLSAGSLVAVRQ